MHGVQFLRRHKSVQMAKPSRPQKGTHLCSKPTCRLRVWYTVSAPNTSTSPSLVATPLTSPAAFRAAQVASASPGASTTGRPCTPVQKDFEPHLGLHNKPQHSLGQSQQVGPCAARGTL